LMPVMPKIFVPTNRKVDTIEEEPFCRTLRRVLCTVKRLSGMEVNCWGGQRVESGELRVKSREQRVESREQRTESGEQRAESREQRVESREQRAESREGGVSNVSNHKCNQSK
jgi:hypothetical protein